jgi:inorganic pyrophosphatase/exopolyphosphatase
MQNDKPDIGTINYDTELVHAVNYFSRTEGHKYELKKLIARAQQDQQHDESLESYDRLMRRRLSNAIFVGHVNTDLDSVAGAIGAAALFGGRPAISQAESTLNGEIQFALKYCGIETPPQFDSIKGSATNDVVLVDHTEEKQMVPSIRDSRNRAERIVAVLDHHALAKTFYTSKPIIMDLRPWGSVSTIIAVLFIHHKKFLPKPLAKLLLQAILSDTLNLRSGTTTEADSGMVALLSAYGGISNIKKIDDADKGAFSSKTAAYKETEIDFLAKRQFQAKTDWIVALGAYEMVRGDQKDFSCGPWKFGISVLEVTDTSKVLEMAEAILLELRLLKKEKGLLATESLDDKQDQQQSSTSASASTSEPVTSMELHRTRELDFAFLFVINIVEQNSILLIPGGRELALAKAAFLELDAATADGVYLQQAYPGITAPGSTIKAEETAMHLPVGNVSRKAQFVPAFFQAIEKDFSYEAKGPVSLDADRDSRYSDGDSQDVLDAIAMSKQGKSQQQASNQRLGIDTGIEGELLAQKEEREEREFLARQERYASSMDGNLYDRNGKIRRAYSTHS